MSSNVNILDEWIVRYLSARPSYHGWSGVDSDDAGRMATVVRVLDVRREA